MADAYPVRAHLPWAEEDGRVVVLLPKRLGLLSRALRRLVRGPSHVRVALDGVGSRTFLLADGSRTSNEVAALLEKEFAEHAGPRDRSLSFLRTLARNGMLQFRVTRAEAPPARMPTEAIACRACGRVFHHAEPVGAALRCPRCKGRQAPGKENRQGRP